MRDERTAAIDVDVNEGRRVLHIEARAILDSAETLGPSFSAAVDLIMACAGKVIVTGIGKSGQIARKVASTLSSTGTPALFLHPAESSHGDMGVITGTDLVIGFSYGGESSEMAALLSYCARRDVPVIAFTGKSTSSLARAARVFIDVAVSEEACPLGLAPTSSSTVSLALGDALAMAVLKRRGFAKEDFAQFHPGGSLGRRLTLRVRDVMHAGDALPLVTLDEDMKRVIAMMASREVRGVAGVIDANGTLVGVITDGDIRRRLERSSNPLDEVARQVMSKRPKMIAADELAEKAAFLMQKHKIDRLFVFDGAESDAPKPLGLVHFQDLLDAGVR